MAADTQPSVHLDPERSQAERVADLIGRLTLQEKIGMMTSQRRASPAWASPRTTSGAKRCTA